MIASRAALTTILILVTTTLAGTPQAQVTVAPTTDAELVAQVTMLKKQIARMQDDYAVLLTTCSTAPKPAPTKAATSAVAEVAPTRSAPAVAAPPAAAPRAVAAPATVTAARAEPASPAPAVAPSPSAPAEAPAPTAAVANPASARPVAPASAEDVLIIIKATCEKEWREDLAKRADCETNQFSAHVKITARTDAGMMRTPAAENISSKCKGQAQNDFVLTNSCEEEQLKVAGLIQ